ncbi:GGDEF domain-containing protein [Actinoplanes oblitus]|uniref:GGDEF domain-containing protein n=1 Tax=Actinoplanes oblitus TaxID=3040509 RepID=A0ABY8WRV9_9ACTN|nr:GGDEF domain-containing protein [Actinoplanes oblitus]WIM98535.1 GGDEF domain-containing protein [Actinoplanes oblitus]
MRWPHATAPAWIVHAGFLICALGAGGGFALAAPGARAAIYTLVVMVSIALFGMALLAGHLTHRRPWLVAIGGLLLLLAGQLLWPYWIVGGHLGRAEGRPADLLLAAAHGLFLIGAALAVRHRMSADAGGIVDAAMVGVCAGGALWIWVFQPHLPAGATPVGQVQVLTDVLVLCAVTGCLLRMAGAADGPARTTLGYLLLTVVLTGTALTVGALGVPHRGAWSGTLMLLAFLTIAAGAVHPGAPAAVEPASVAERPAGRFRLGWLGVALSVNPAITAVQALRGDAQAASPQLPIATLLVIPLVLIRFRQLSGQRERAERVLAYQASHDELTGLVNRRQMMAEIDSALAGPHPVTVLLCDLDGFKPVNDRYGHAAGDEVLRTVAARLTEVAGPDRPVGRLGGDEFVVLCQGGTEAQVAGLRERVTGALSVPIPLPAGPVSIGVTIGAARSTPSAPLDRTALIAQADAAMYAGKPTRHPRAA